MDVAYQQSFNMAVVATKYSIISLGAEDAKLSLACLARQDTSEDPMGEFRSISFKGIKPKYTIEAAAAQEDNQKIIVVGTSYQSIFVVHLHPDGALDASFGKDG